MRWMALLLAIVGCGCGDSAGDDEPGNVDAAVASIDAADCSREVRSVDVGEVTLDVAYEGCGPTVVLLHGFPEIALGWSEVAADLSADFQVVMPDQRGYNTSDVPPNVDDYQIAHMVADILGLIEATTDEPVLLVAHDWGGAVAWQFAHEHPDKLRGLVILNAPHPDVFAAALEDEDQFNAAQYMNFFINPQAESFLSGNNYQGLIDVFAGALTPELEAAHRVAYAQPGALTGMLNWYRANIDTGPAPKKDWPTDVTIAVPTLVMWGMDDTALLPINLVGLDQYVTDLTVREVDGADHWLVHRAPQTVIDEIRTFSMANP